MAFTKEFEETVEQNKLIRVRIILKDSLLLDPSCKKFVQMFEYAKGKMPDLVDEHDGEIFKGADAWDEDYLNEQMVKVVNNFSAERIEILQQMVKKLYSKAENEEKKSPNDEDRSEGSGFSAKKKVGIAVAVIGAGLIVGGMIGTDASKAMLIAGGIALAAGGIMIFTDK